MPLIGIIPNPASGKDIRRLVVDADGIDNQHKAKIVRRVLRGIAATSNVEVTTVAVMPEMADIRRQALDGLALPFPVDVLDTPCHGRPEDSLAAARTLADRGARDPAGFPCSWPPPRGRSRPRPSRPGQR